MLAIVDKLKISPAREPNRETDFEVQAHLWTELRKLGFNIRGEVQVVFDNDGRKRREQCRFDLAHFVGGELMGIIEVKAQRIKHKNEGGWQVTRQGKRYHTFGVPVRIVYGMEGAAALLEDAKIGKLF
jgi:hypothetical protein